MNTSSYFMAGIISHGMPKYVVGKRNETTTVGETASSPPKLIPLSPTVKKLSACSKSSLGGKTIVFKALLLQ